MLHKEKGTHGYALYQPNEISERSSFLVVIYEGLPATSKLGKFQINQMSAKADI